MSTGIAIGVPLLHFTLWPWTIGRRIPVPVLVEAEGLPASLLPLYNALLYAWAGAGVGALVVDTPPRHRRLGVVALAIVLASRPLVRRHFEWMSDEARRRPRWWNRAWLRSPRWSST